MAWYLIPLVLVGYALANKIVKSLTSPLRSLRGPPSESLLLGNTRQSLNVHLSVPWFKEYGPTLKSNLGLGNHALFTIDSKAIQHVLGRPDVFEKPDSIKFLVSTLTGLNGLALVEGEQHKRQRRVLNPAFSPNQLRQYTHIFNSEAQKFRAQLAEEASNQSVNFLSLVSQTTMQILCLCGFACDMKKDGQELNKMITKAFQTTKTSRITLQTLQAVLPVLRIFPYPGQHIFSAARAEMRRIGMALIQGMKQSTTEKALEKDAVSRNDIAGRDILSLLIRANLADDLPDSQRLTDEEVISQIPTFLLAGTETTAVGVSWVIYNLCKHPEAQAKLRQELYAIDHDDPTMEELNSLKYLDNVLRETLRLFPPFGSTSRVANQDHIIPLAVPIKDKNGAQLQEIRIAKGQMVYINFEAMQLSEEIWGPDAAEFKPERWDKELHKQSLSIPGVWGNLMTFGGGPRSCIGFQFSLVESKALLFCLLRAFEFKLTVPISSIYGRATVVTRPSFSEELGGLNNLPVMVTPCAQ